MNAFFTTYIDNAVAGIYKNVKNTRVISFVFLAIISVACSKETAPIQLENPANGFAVDDTVPNYKCTTVVGTVDDIRKALSNSIDAGTVICIAPGVYNDLSFTYGGNGNSNQPIVLTAQVPGSVIISGVSRVRMTGAYVVLQGIIFQDGNSGPSAFILLRRGDETCSYCRVTENTIVNWDQGNNDKNNWISISGQYNRVDHNWVSGKKNRGGMVYVDRRDGEPDYARIDHNYFGDRPPYGGKAYPSAKDGDLEVIRLGSSRHHEASSFSRVEHNLFESIRAETEIISIKSSRNIIHGNTFRGSYGSVSNRHGSHNVYSNNFILGDGYPFAGGIRVADAGHVIVNNYIDGVSYPGTLNHGAIVLMAADDPVKYEAGFSGYKQVENITIAHNTIVNSVSSFMFYGGNKRFAPRNITLVNNVVSAAVGPVITHIDKGLPKDSLISHNYVVGSELTDSTDYKTIDGFIYGDPMFENSGGMVRPMPESKVIGGGLDLSSVLSGKELEELYIDMDGQPRTKPVDAGADQVAIGSGSVLFPLTKDKVGPKSY